MNRHKQEFKNDLNGTSNFRFTAFAETQAQNYVLCPPRDGYGIDRDEFTSTLQRVSRKIEPSSPGEGRFET